MGLMVIATTSDAKPLAADQHSVDRFTRSAVRTYLEIVVVPIGGTAFLVFAAWLLGQVGTDPSFLVLAGLAAFFGVLLLSGIPSLLRRGLGLTMLEVGPDGIWHRDVGRLTWTDIAEVRIERNRGAAGRGTTIYRRLGIVPSDPDRAAAVSRSLAWRMSRAFIRFANEQARRRGADVALTDVDAIAPLGVYASEIQQPFEDLVTSVRRFLPVGERLDAREQLESASAAPLESRPDRPLTEEDLREIDGRLGGIEGA